MFYCEPKSEERTIYIASRAFERTFIVERKSFSKLMEYDVLLSIIIHKGGIYHHPSDHPKLSSVLQPTPHPTKIQVKKKIEFFVSSENHTLSSIRREYEELENRARSGKNREGS